MDWLVEQEDLFMQMKALGTLRSKEIEKAMADVPRHLFVPKSLERYAYKDTPLSIGHDQTISQPSTVALMTWMLDVEPRNKVLEIGSGSGWQAAIISKLGAKVWTIERLKELADFARKNLKKNKIKNVEVIHGDGSQGLKKNAPYDRIIVTCACPEMIEPLVEQLKEGGKMVIPVGDRYMQHMLVVTKKKGKIKKKDMGRFMFVPLIGKYGFKR
ncbi:MAG: protein-L-isoaspartate(D-aspartate) O-methyltransferase [Candidatus Aenigmatarchaeota archaeon]